MKTILTATALAFAIPVLAIPVLAIPMSAAFADEKCNVSAENMQPLEALVRVTDGLGWTISEMELDDGCWEVKARDAQGRRIKAKLDPATLQVVKMRHRDDRHARDRAGGDAPAIAPSAPPANPLFQSGTAPVVRVN